jgi:hypothetical protein
MNEDFRTPISTKHGIICGKQGMNKGFITIDQCLECAGPKNIRCIPRNFLLAHVLKEGNPYYSRKIGEYHVSDYVGCAAEFLFKNFIGYFYTPRSLWNMGFGTAVHSMFNDYELSKPTSESKLEHVFESNGRKVAIVGSQDGYFKDLDLGIFTDVEERLLFDNFDDNVYDGSGVLHGVLLERKTAQSINNVMYKPKDIHLLQEQAYVVMRSENDVNWIITTYLSKPDGREINLVMPVLYIGSEIHKNASPELLSKAMVVNKADVMAKMEKRVATFEWCLFNREFPYRFPNFKVQCDWCDMKDACKGTPNVPIVDKDELVAKIELWSNILRVSDRFEDEGASNMQQIAERWPRGSHD